MAATFAGDSDNFNGHFSCGQTYLDVRAATAADVAAHRLALPSPLSDFEGDLRVSRYVGRQETCGTALAGEAQP